MVYDSVELLLVIILSNRDAVACTKANLLMRLTIVDII